MGGRKRRKEISMMLKLCVVVSDSGKYFVNMLMGMNMNDGNGNLGWVWRDFLVKKRRKFELKIQ